MDKYQEALERARVCGDRDCSDCKFNEICANDKKGWYGTLKELVDQQAILEEYNVTPEILREVLLTGQMFRNQPTLDECIKEWEDRGYIVETEKITNGIFIYKNNKLKTKIVFIRKTKLKTKTKTTCRFFCIADYELLNLISKTLKACEEKKDE